MSANTAQRGDVNMDPTWSTKLQQQAYAMSEETERLRADLDAALARVKELEGEVFKVRAEAYELTSHRDPNLNSALRDLGNARVALDAANADRARLREALNLCVVALPQGLAGSIYANAYEAGRAARASTDAAQWLRERERRVAERVREACAELFRHPWRINDITRHEAYERVRTLDLDALLGEP